MFFSERCKFSLAENEELAVNVFGNSEINPYSITLSYFASIFVISNATFPPQELATASGVLKGNLILCVYGLLFLFI